MRSITALRFQCTIGFLVTILSPAGKRIWYLSISWRCYRENVWVEKRHMREGVSSAAVCACSEMIYVIGGGPSVKVSTEKVQVVRSIKLRLSLRTLNKKMPMVTLLTLWGVNWLMFLFHCTVTRFTILPWIRGGYPPHSRSRLNASMRYRWEALYTLWEEPYATFSVLTQLMKCGVQ